MMTTETKATVDSFLNRGGYVVPFARAGSIVGLAPTDATNWRTRGLLAFPPEKIGGRYFVTRDGLIALGVMAELAWLIGPENARAVAVAIWETLFARSPHGLDLDDFADTAVVFRKPIGDVAGLSPLPRFPSADESDRSRVLGFPLELVSGRELSRNPVPDSTLVVLPIGRLVCRWALAIEAA